VPWFAVRTDTSAARYIDADYFSFKGHIVGSSIVRQ
jgi:hypothetical protein